MTKQDEVRKAHTEFEEAIKKFIKVRDGENEDEGLLVDWSLVTAHHFDNGDGASLTAVGWYAPLDQRLYQQLGLLEFAATRVRKFIAE